MGKTHRWIPEELNTCIELIMLKFHTESFLEEFKSTKLNGEAFLSYNDSAN